MPIVLAPGDVYVNADFGYQPVDEFGDPSGSNISGTVYFDADANADLDGVDYGIAGVTVALLDTNGNVIATTTTDATATTPSAACPRATTPCGSTTPATCSAGCTRPRIPTPTVDSRHRHRQWESTMSRISTSATPRGHTLRRRPDRRHDLPRPRRQRRADPAKGCKG
jgi:hypothetical protein